LIVLPQQVKIKWNGTNKKYYMDLGYEYTNQGLYFLVDVNHLSRGTTVRVDVECDYCGEINKVIYSSYVKSLEKSPLNKVACSKCRGKKTKEEGIRKPNKTRRKITTEFAKQEFLKRNYIMLSEYKDAHTDIEYICNLHNDEVQIINWDRFTQGKGCKHCANEARRNHFRKYTIDDVRTIFANRDCILLSDEYINMNQKLEYICKCGNYYTKNLYEFKINKYTCESCEYEMRAGENHPNWQGGISSERDKMKFTDEYKNWRIKVFERDDYTCQCCGKRGVKLHAHHIQNFSQYPELRVDIENGITLCESCHSPSIKGSFHNIYGTHNNNRQQLEEYIKIRRQKVS
jgi:hypothetical protein